MTSTDFKTEVNMKLPMGNGVFAVIETGSLIINPSDSSAIERINYMTTDSVLVVTYKSSKTQYFYQGVPPIVAMQLLVADSFGAFINAHIKGEYEFWSI
jgi:hypothetical protein